MAKEKITLDDLKVQSFVTTLDESQMTKVKGGFLTVRGRKSGYRTRWTSVDTRSTSALADEVHSTTGGGMRN